jgi:hypothetical protein
MKLITITASLLFLATMNLAGWAFAEESSPKLVEILHGSQVQLGDLRRG